MQSLQNSDEIKEALLNTDKGDKALVVCNLAKDILSASLVYLMDINGNVISSTNYYNNEGIELNLIGNNYAFRPYFFEALKGKSIIYPAVGITTGKRGIYCSAPVYDSSDKNIIGVIILKFNVTQIDDELNKHNQKILLLSPEQIVFSSNNDKWLYGVPEEKYQLIKAYIKKSKQFNENKINVLPFSFDNERVFLNDTTFLLERKTIAASNWSLVILEPRNAEHPINKNLIKIIFFIILIFIILSGIIFSLLYILRQKRIAEQNLKRNKEGLKTTLYSIGEGVIAVNTNGIILQINPVAANLIGIEISAALGKPISNLFHVLNPKTKKPDLQIINAINEGRTNNIDETILQSSSGKEYEIFVLLNSLTDENGTLLGMVLIFRDISHEKETRLKLKNQYHQIKEALKRAEESDRLKTAFLQNISHEIRTPLNGIVGFSELLSATELTQEIIEEYRDHIISNANYLLEVIHNVIEISKLETNQIKLNLVRFDLNDICKDIFSRYKTLHTEVTKVKLNLLIPNEDKSLFIKNDLNKITKIFHILLDNAYKFTNSGTISFGYELNQNQIQCFVKDTGIGIHEDLHGDIFKHFRQIPNTKKKVSKGIGIGLAIAQSYILLLGGSIWLESENNKGSDFYFILPLKK